MAEPSIKETDKTLDFAEAGQDSSNGHLSMLS